MVIQICPRLAAFQSMVVKAVFTGKVKLTSVPAINMEMFGSLSRKKGVVWKSTLPQLVSPLCLLLVAVLQ